MKTLNFMNGCCLKINDQVNLTGLFILMMILSTLSIAQEAVQHEKLSPADTDFLEFLSLYDENNAYFFDETINEISNEDSNQRTSIAEEPNK